MDDTFFKLIQRGTAKKETTIADPWETIPIKNRKYARECIEMHLAKRGIQQLKEFENFPNLEILYLNDNKLESIEGLDANFRVKNLYLFNNKLKTLEGSLEYLKHLEVLLLYSNELRDLDKNIEFLKNYPNLKTLDIFDNPLCEEPNYRLRVVYNLPQLRLLDRHKITQQEREQAKKLMESEDFRKKKKEFKKRILPSQMFSMSERDLYKEAAKIKHKRQEEIDEAIRQEQKKKEDKIKKQAEIDATKVPKSKLAIEIDKRRKQFPNACISEFEKDKIRKLFKAYDKEKKAIISKENLENLYEDLINDAGMIGIVPSASLEEFVNTINPDNKEEIDYDTYRFNMNLIYWEKPDYQLTQTRIDKLYHTANQKINRGNKNEAYQDLNIAIRLQSKLQLDDSKPIFSQKKVEAKGPTRFDSFDMTKYTHRSTFQNTAKVIL